MAKSNQETNCLWAQGVIDSYIDGELTGVEASRLESHLSACSVCTEELELARRVKSTLRDFPQQHCPDRVVAAALDQVGSKPPSTKLFRPWAWVGHDRRERIMVGVGVIQQHALVERHDQGVIDVIGVGVGDGHGGLLQSRRCFS